MKHSALVSAIWTSVVLAGIAMGGATWAAEAGKSQSTASGPAPSAKARILVLTGNEYPGHKWKETAPLIARFLAIDRRLTVEVNSEPQFLAAPELHTFDAIVLNYLNWQSPVPGGKKACENLKSFIAGGKGLVLVHNAVAAFGDQRVMRDGKFIRIDECGWPEVREIFGRAWNPNRLRGHDPNGPFRVEITGAEHPITKGMKSFETTDELYTCLFTDGRPVEVLAKATSKVDSKDYPMVLVNHYGQGRVFLCLLGHDVKALSVEAVQELYRRGTAWAAGLPPVCP
ncbi:MAG: ThuA domain-containing protein [Verrucomicrobia bacterium]|nr:ThuA domain-containing protein [Verrucomicrobiota bacterium]